MLHLIAVALLAVSATACSATAPDNDEPDGARHRVPIVNGTETSDYPATGMLLMQGQVGCTGTLVAQSTVLTAAHCIDGMQPGSLEFGFGPDQYQIDVTVPVAAVAQHPQWDSQNLANDVGVLTLAQDAPIAPVTMNPSMDQSWIGKVVTLVGYGVTDGASQTGIGTKRMVDVTIDSLDAATLHYTTEQGKTACNGDSGGPAFYEENGQLLVVGVTSYGDQQCQQYGVYTRVDAFLDWVQQQITAPTADPNDPNAPVDPNDPNAPIDPNDPYPPVDPSDPGGGDPGCQGETYEGRCEGNVVIWCESGQVMSIDCWSGCGFDPQAGFYDCL
jgi:secreted trypsin-like serine protease